MELDLPESTPTGGETRSAKPMKPMKSPCYRLPFGPNIQAGSGFATRMIREFIISDPEIHDGEPIFAGTGVTVETFLRYRRGDTPVYEFLIDNPSVAPEHAKRLARWLATQDSETIRARLEQIRVRQPNHHE